MLVVALLTQVSEPITVSVVFVLTLKFVKLAVSELGLLPDVVIRLLVPPPVVLVILHPLQSLVPGALIAKPPLPVPVTTTAFACEESRTAKSPAVANLIAVFIFAPANIKFISHLIFHKRQELSITAWMFHQNRMSLI